MAKYLDPRADVAQTHKGMVYENLLPVYALNFVNGVFMKDVDSYYHYYHLVHDRYTDKVIDGLHLILWSCPSLSREKLQREEDADALAALSHRDRRGHQGGAGRAVGEC